ncbi:hypothetical protein FACS1894193_02360 [Bacilli bacterium]|nr:hypothetical protein FACS1894193_02360 [Bacilli bacterium]
MEIKMSKYKKYPLILLSLIIFIVMIGISIKFVSNQKMFKKEDSKVMEKENENYGVIEPKSQVEGDFIPVKEIEIGETYILMPDYGGTVLRFYKLIDEKRFIYVYDHAHTSMENYADYEEGVSEEHLRYNDKSIRIATGTYEKTDDVYSFKIEQVSGASFNYKEDVKKGSKGYNGGIENTNYISSGNTVDLGLKDEKYGAVTSDGYTFRDCMLYRSKIKLPDTIEEYLSQYDLTERNSQSSSSSDVKPQSHWRSDEEQEEMARAFGFDIPVSEDDDGFKIFGF